MSGSRVFLSRAGPDGLGRRARRSLGRWYCWPCHFGVILVFLGIVGFLLGAFWCFLIFGVLRGTFRRWATLDYRQRERDQGKNGWPSSFPGWLDCSVALSAFERKQEGDAPTVIAELQNATDKQNAMGKSGWQVRRTLGKERPFALASEAWKATRQQRAWRT